MPSPTEPSASPSLPEHAQPQQSQQPPSDQSTDSRLRNSTKLLVGGCAFLVLSTIVTRRALGRRQLTTAAEAAAAAASSSTPSAASTASTASSTPTKSAPRVSGATDALEALHLATLNVASLAMIGAGAGMRLFDVETLDEMRRKVRGGVGADGTGRSEKEVEEEWEEWIATTLARKKEKDGRRVAGGREEER